MPQVNMLEAYFYLHAKIGKLLESVDEKIHHT